MKEFIKLQLGKSQLIRTIYNACVKTYARLYQRMNQTDRSTEYQAILKPSDNHSGFSGETLFENGTDLSPHPQANNPVLTKDDITDAKATFVADPFLVFADGVYNMFFEIKNIAGDVYIGHAFSKDGFEYTYNQTVIAPDVAHHTYPYVFRLDGQWFMTPSPGLNVEGEFRIYRAVNFPTDWELAATPIKKRVRQDPTPILKNGTWYLIYQDTDNLDIILKYSDTLYEEPWNEHPSSPIFQNDTKKLEQCPIGSAEMVPSGRPIYHEDNIDLFYRSHLNTEIYHYRITTLNRDSFEQHPVSKNAVFAEKKTRLWNQRFMHTVNPVYPWKGTDNIVAIDGLKKDDYEYSIGIYTN
jgi:hypothetical protein